MLCYTMQIKRQAVRLSSQGRERKRERAGAWSMVSMQGYHHHMPSSSAVGTRRNPQRCAGHQMLVLPTPQTHKRVAALPQSHQLSVFSNSSRSHTSHTSRLHSYARYSINTTSHQPGAPRSVPRGGAATAAFTPTTSTTPDPAATSRPDNRLRIRSIVSP